MVMKNERVAWWSLGLIAAFMLPVGLQAAFQPRAWFDDFPLGRSWIAAERGAYGEHLVRDVGVLFLALIVVTVWAVWKHVAMAAVAGAWLLQGSLHLVYRVGHLDQYETLDRVGGSSSRWWAYPCWPRLGCGYPPAPAFR
jgi:hypothetical protein